MESLPSFNQGNHTGMSEASSLDALLERGIQCFREGCFVEGVTCLALAREKLSVDQMQFAAVLDAFIQSHTSYWQAQQALFMASKRFVEIESEQQIRLLSLEKLLLTLKKDTNTTSQPQAVAQPFLNIQSDQAQQLQRPSSSGSDEEQSQLSLPPFSKDRKALGSSSFRETAGDHNGPPGHSTPPSPLRGGFFTCKDEELALPALYVTCFGHFEVRRFDQAIALCRNRNGQAILHYLIAQPDYSASADTLMGVFWPEDAQEVARRKLQIAVSSARHSLNSGYSCDPGGGYILRKNQFYQVNSTVTIHSDVDEFLSLWKAGQQASASQATILYESACQLYIGPFLVEDLYADWSFARREQLHQIYVAMCRALANYYTETGRYEDARKWTSAILKEDHCDEEAHRQLIRIYSAEGRRSEALRQFQRCERILADELGVSPMPETMLLLQTILTGKPIQ